MYYELWMKYDPKGTEFIPFDQLFEFVADLDKPLGIPRPNRFKLISMNLPICDKGMIHCSDILGGDFNYSVFLVTKYFLN
jgi:hypothetical protein